MKKNKGLVLDKMTFGELVDEPKFSKAYAKAKKLHEKFEAAGRGYTILPTTVNLERLAKAAQAWTAADMYEELMRATAPQRIMNKRAGK